MCRVYVWGCGVCMGVMEVWGMGLWGVCEVMGVWRYGVCMRMWGMCEGVDRVGVWRCVQEHGTPHRMVDKNRRHMEGSWERH